MTATTHDNANDYPCECCHETGLIGDRGDYCDGASPSLHFCHCERGNEKQDHEEARETQAAGNDWPERERVPLVWGGDLEEMR